MAPRILHFCKDQIASECREFDAAETRPRGISNFQLHFDNIVSENRLKGLDPEVDGKRLRLQRLQAAKEPDKHLVPGIYTFELWARIVEVYSNTAIINSNDKLIALAGVAKWMSGFMKSDYVAGLWREHLASQLLWRVVSVFQSHNRSFSNPSQRPSLYRAPTFSWASVDADNGSGIIYGEVTDQDLFIEIAGVHVTTTNPENPFGLIKDAHLKIWGKLRKIDLFEKINEKGELNGRYGWRLHGMGEDVDKEEHTNVYLDCPEQDGGLAVEGHDRDDRSRRGGIFDSNDIWCIPAAEGERAATRESRYLICLLLQEVKGRRLGPGTFRRIGLSKLSPWGE
ncbi:uncharacterized protein BCR38DRAFT_330862 [Pseudomassariella vexata]|uniref:Uncharacterized protein n=1 Tax=Pseudomassariella vexata TaxID=1141098 RepID=A0A1Y2EJ57_9PEZI|nr:uncharacterized protein BCR38DRAFT_330862 [Pseudomassariella vexata]ORY71276.1 hypothetical protein BCR38DRAFT_330862 [Pseudomassariella vexata]